MKSTFKTRAAAIALGLAPLATAMTAPLPAVAQEAKPEIVNLSTGTGRLVNLPGKMADHDRSHASELVDLVQELGAPLAAQIFETLVPVFASRAKA